MEAGERAGLVHHQTHSFISWREGFTASINSALFRVNFFLLCWLIDFLVWELLAALATVLFFPCERMLFPCRPARFDYTRDSWSKHGKWASPVKPENTTVLPFPSSPPLVPDFLLPLAKGIIRCLMTRWGPEEGQSTSLRLLMCGQPVQPRWPLVCRWKEAANQINYIAWPQHQQRLMRI